MKSSGRERETSRSGLIAVLLLSSLLLAGVLTWQAQASMRYHRATAEKVLRDYAMLAADEFARRSVNELGFYGFYPVVTVVRQEAARGRLIPPAEIQASRDEAVQPASDLVKSTFRLDAASGVLETLGPQPDPALRAWMAKQIVAGAASAPLDRRYVTIHGIFAGSVHSLLFGPADRSPNAPLAGFEAAGSAFASRFAKAVRKGPLFPPSLAHGAISNDALFLRLVDPAGREVFRAGSPRQPYLVVERPFGEDYNGVLSGFVIFAAVDPAAASSLVIGGLPRSRLPFLLGLLALTTGLILTAVLQLRRERALSEMRSHFVSRVSHELRTPLTQIRMFAETLLLNRVRTEDERQRSLEIIDRESRRLTHLVENVLRFSRGERGQDRVDIGTFDVIPLACQILADFEPLVRGRATLSATLPESAIARTDEGALRQTLLNLLDNAVKYGPEGGEIRLSIESADGIVRLSVDDDGPGIPPGERERVWGRFYRLARDRESAVAGTGIGLSIVRDLTRLQGGRAFVETGPRGGARFVIELPRAAEQESPP